MLGLGAPELLIIFAIVLVVFGSTRVPKLARSLGQAKRELQAGLDGAPEHGEEAAKK